MAMKQEIETRAPIAPDLGMSVQDQIQTSICEANHWIDLSLKFSEVKKLTSALQCLETAIAKLSRAQFLSANQAGTETEYNK